jgi:cytochrome c-type biogenesis protein CcmH
MKRLYIILLLLLLWTPARAVEPDEILQDPALEARARAITKQIRCLVCQGEDIDASGAPLASDLRKLVRERLKEGDTDAQALEYIRARYGDYVLMNPPVAERTLLLWGAPAIVFCVGLAVVFVYVRRQAKWAS